MKRNKSNAKPFVFLTKSIFFSGIGFILLCLPQFFLENDLPAGLCSVLGLFFFIAAGKSFSRKGDTLLGCLLFWLGLGVRFSRLIGTEFLLSCVAIAIALPYSLALFCGFMLDNLLIRKKHRIAAVFAFPMVYTALTCVMSLISLGYITNLFNYCFCIPAFGWNISWLSEYGMTFVISLILSLLAELLVYPGFKIKAICGLCSVILCAVFLVVGACNLNTCPAADYTLNVAVGVSQQMDFLGRDDHEYTFEETRIVLNQALREASEGKADLLVLSEEYMTLSSENEAEALQEISGMVRQYGIPVLMGLEITMPEGELDINEAVYFDARGELVSTYVKKNLVPLVEGGYYVVGKEDPPVLTVSLGGHELRLSYMICFDINNGFFARRVSDDVELLIVPSWDWERCNIEQKRTFVRSMELQTTVLKHTYDGFTYVSGPSGLCGDMLDNRGVYEAVRFIEVPIWKK